MKPQIGTQNWLKPPNRQTIIDPQITQRANAKDLRKTGNVVCLIEPIRKGQKPISGEHMKKLFDSGELGGAESKNSPKLQRTT